MKYFFLISCLILCSCSSKDEEKAPCVQIGDSCFPCIQIGDSCYPQAVYSNEPCSMPVYVPFGDPDPLVFGYCPAEDVAEYPVRDTLPYNWCNADYPLGHCFPKLKLSKEELLFGAQGGVRCITTDRDFGLFGAYESKSNYWLICSYEDEAGDWGIDGGGNPIVYFKKQKCPEENPWLAATKIDTRVLHISVDKNETGSERKIYIKTSCQGTLSITQLAD